MDIKAPLERYREVTRSNVDVERIVRSVDAIRTSGVRHTFRTTVVPGLVGKDDVRRIGEWLHGVPSYSVQAFAPNNPIDPAYLEKKPYSRTELEAILDAARPFFEDVRLEDA